VGAIAVAAGLTSGAAAGPQDSQPAPQFVSAPRSGSVGEPVTIAARGLRTSQEAGRAPRDFNYRATFDRLARVDNGLDCVRTIDRPWVGRSRTRTYEWNGRIPRTLRCYARGRFVREIPVRTGTYRWVVGVKRGKRAWDRSASLLVRRVRVTAG